MHRTIAQGTDSRIVSAGRSCRPAGDL